MSYDDLSKIVAAIGRPQFGPCFFDHFSKALGVEQCTVFAFTAQRPPVALLAEASDPQLQATMNVLARDYENGAYVRDPNVQSHRFSRVPTVYSLQADAVHDPAYRSRFYDHAHIAHELVMLGKVDDGTRYYTSFYRAEGGRSFTARDLETVRSVAGFAVGALHRHCELTLRERWTTRQDVDPMIRAPSCHPHSRAWLMAAIRATLLSEDCRLSQREAEVCTAIVLGCTSVGIGLMFGITPNTVVTHRRRAYRKLGVASQNELFARCLRLAGFHPRSEFAEARADVIR